MKTKFLLFLIFVCAPYLGKAQNLVPNGGFEEVINCPTTYSALQDDCANWFGSIQIPGNEPNENPSPDWFHTCSIYNELTPPTTILGGYQEPLGGGGYAGLVTYVLTGDTNAREIIGVELTESLQFGHNYHVVFNVSKGFAIGGSLASNKIGVKFTTQATFSSNEVAINNEAHFQVDTIITDTLNWVPIAFDYTADQDYSYIHIGNFFDKPHTEYYNIGQNSDPYAYYLIDDISIVEIITGIKENSGGQFALYPNPANDLLHISSMNSFTIYQVLDITGKICQQGSLSNDIVQTIVINGIKEGVYFLRVSDKNENYYFNKFIKL